MISSALGILTTVFCGCFWTVKSQGIQEIILNDLFHESTGSTRCTNHKKGIANNGTDIGSSSFTLEFTPSQSSWRPAIVDFEKFLFKAEMHYKDQNNPSRSWNIRIGRGGNIYSFRGPLFGEAISPQNLNNAPWVDEVLQSVSVSQGKNRAEGTSPYFIHQAGVYTKDGGYTELPFYSPSIARYCEENYEEGIFQCSFGSWGQQAHVPVTHESPVLYFNRYKDCGDGVIEFTSIIHNISPRSMVFENNESVGETLSYLNVPWGGIRTSTFPNIYLSNPEGRLKLHFPLQKFGNERTTPNLKATGGFTTFAQRMKMSEEDKKNERCLIFDMPESDGKGGILPLAQARKKKAQRLLQNRRNLVNANETTSNNECDSKSPLIQNVCGVTEQASERKTNDENKNISNNGLDEEFRLIVRTDNPCHESKFHTVNRKKFTVSLNIEPTVEIKKGQQDDLKFINRRTGMFVRTDGVLHWSWQGNRLFFHPSEGTTCKEINDIFSKGDQIEVSLCFDVEEELEDEKKDNLALTFVHGKDSESAAKSPKKNQWITLPSRLRFGKTSPDRDFTVFTVNVRAKVNPGDTFSYRQYILVDTFEATEERAMSWVPETKQQLIHSGEYKKSTTIRLVLSSDGLSYGATHEKSVYFQKNEQDFVCEGQSTPFDNKLRPLLSIQCGDLWHTGTNLYHFAPRGSFSKKRESDDETHELHKRFELPIKRSYACRNDKTLKPKWKILGFFEENSCDVLRELPYDSTLFTSAPPTDKYHQSYKDEL